jgi:hypothetical protein
MEIGPAEVRHAIRGTMNALKLCVSAFEMPLEPSEKLEFLADVELSADKLVSLLDQYEAFPPPAQQPAPPPVDGQPSPLHAVAKGAQ